MITISALGEQRGETSRPTRGETSVEKQAFYGLTRGETSVEKQALYGLKIVTMVGCLPQDK
jgi:hypothetical protein